MTNAVSWKTDKVMSVIFWRSLVTQEKKRGLVSMVTQSRDPHPYHVRSPRSVKNIKKHYFVDFGVDSFTWLKDTIN